MSPKPDSAFYHFYDLEYNPPTFNILHQIISAELCRVEYTNCTHTHVVFVPGSHDGFNQLKHYGTDVKRWRFGNILIPSLSLMPSNTSYEVLNAREDALHLVERAGANKFPIGYTVENSADCSQHNSHSLNYGLGYRLPSLRASTLALEYVDRFIQRVCGNQEFITIVLRQASYISSRNSDLGDWKTVAKYMQDAGYFVFVLPDYEVVLDEVDDLIPGSYLARECVLDLRLRIALYERACLNLGQGGGGLTCCYLNENCNYVMSRLLVEGVGHSTEEYVAKMGHTLGKDVSYYDTFARWIWNQDSVDSILTVCEEFIDKHENDMNLQSENRLTGDGPFQMLVDLYGRHKAKEIFAEFGERRNGPLFMNRERNNAADRQNPFPVQLRFLNIDWKERLKAKGPVQTRDIGYLNGTLTSLE